MLEQNRRESEAKITKMVDERLFSLKLDLAKEKKVREEGEERYYKTFGEQINRLQEEIDLENKMRDDNSQKLVKRLSEEIGKFHEMLIFERKVFKYLVLIVYLAKRRNINYYVQNDRRYTWKSYV